jgi:hypothetical protein
MNLPIPRKQDDNANNNNDNREPTWMVVATTAGVTEAHVIAQRLKSLGIPAAVNWESLGAVLGLTVGMGAARVFVPESFYEFAYATLNPDEEMLWLGDGEDEEDYDDSDEDIK